MKVSVVIPVYNAENTIKRCVESIIENKKEVEIILVEDRSKDNSWERCMELSKQFENIKCFRNEQNKGVSYTRNRGIDEAQGKYLMFVDSDDWVENDYISELLDLCEKVGTVLNICGYVNHDEKVNSSVEYVKWTTFEGAKKCDLQVELKNLYDERLLQQLWNKIFVTKLVRDNDIRFDESISIGEDLRFILEYIRKCKVKEVYLINKALYHYMRDQEGNLMYRVGYESIEEPLKNLRTLYEIMGVLPSNLENIMMRERQKQKELYAYLIYHNAGMERKEKRRLILALDEEQGSKLYKINRNLYYKERIYIFLKKLIRSEKR